ncbi:MAG: Membrane sensor protein UhpC [Chlamydiae bacterium]|nr:Membrane sensor protein UhpC [Chlamydiota bacterium]
MKWAIWGLAAFFYFYEYFLRVAPGVMVPELMSAFSVNATAIGALSGFYFYIYAPMQLPVGILTDRYGARKLLAIAAFVAGMGAIFFSISSYFWIAAFGRILMGIGSSFGFVGLVYICSHWFEKKKRGILLGLGSSIGMLGAVMGEGPLRKMIDAFGWRSVNIQLGVLGFFLAALIFLTVRNEPPEMAEYDKKVKKPTEKIFANLKMVCKNGHSWINAIASLFLYISTPGFAALWGISFIHSIYGISTELSGFAVSMIFIGWAFGGPIIGSISDKFQQKKKLLAIAALAGAFLMGIIIYVPNLPLFTLFTLFFLVGFISGAQLLNYSYSIDIHPEHIKGTATAFTNFMVIAGAALIQPLIGYLLDLNWTGQMANGIRTYSPEAYKIAMSCFPLAFLLSFVFTLFLKEIPPKPLWQK